MWPAMLNSDVADVHDERVGLQCDLGKQRLIAVGTMLVENKVAKTVKHRCPSDVFDRLDHMRMMPNYHICSGLGKQKGSTMLTC